MSPEPPGSFPRVVTRSLQAVGRQRMPKPCDKTQGVRRHLPSHFTQFTVSFLMREVLG